MALHSQDSCNLIVLVAYMYVACLLFHLALFRTCLVFLHVLHANGGVPVGHRSSKSPFAHATHILGFLQNSQLHEPEPYNPRFSPADSHFELVCVCGGGGGGGVLHNSQPATLLYGQGETWGQVGLHAWLGLHLG